MISCFKYTLVRYSPAFFIKQQYYAQSEKIHNNVGKTFIEIDGEVWITRTTGKRCAVAIHKQNNRLVISSDSILATTTGKLKNNDYSVKPTTNCKGFNK